MCDFTTIPGWNEFMASAWAKNVIPFEEARDWARRSGVKTSHEWAKAKLPHGIPRKPLDVYSGKGWINWADFLGTRQRNNFRAFEEARIYALSLKLNSGKIWNTIGHPDDIPLDPVKAYKEWKGWPHFLGTPEPKKVRTFEEAREWARQSGIKSYPQWITTRRAKVLPKDISGRPDKSYAGKGWLGWQDFLGTNFVPYEEASAWAVANEITSIREWQEAKKPENFPASPYSYEEYDNVNFFRKVTLSFEQVRQWARRSGIRSSKEWMKSAKTFPTGVPRNWPKKIYAEEWKGWDDFLGREAS